MTRALLASRVFDVPLLIERCAAESIVSFLADSGHEGFNVEPVMSIEQRVSQARPERSVAYYEEHGGVAVVPIVGELSHRATVMGSMSGSVGYAGLQSRLLDLADSGKVRGMILDMDTPGGEAGGIKELSDALQEISLRMPVWAIANHLMASAGYWIGSGTDRVIATPYARVGSIGVVSMHVDVSKAADKKGMVMTFVHAGARKVDGNPYAPLSPQARASMTAHVEELYGQFVDHVASSRRMDEKAVRGTEARVYGAKEALDLGLVDDISTLSEALGGMKEAIEARRRVAIKGFTMSKTYEDGLSEGKAVGITQGRTEAASDHATALAAAIANTTSSVTLTAGKAERDRISGIINHEEAKGRETMASHLAFQTAMSVEDASGLLKVAAKDTKAAAVVPPKGAKTNTTAENVLDHLRTSSPRIASQDEDPAADSEEARKEELRGMTGRMNSARRPRTHQIAGSTR